MRAQIEKAVERFPKMSANEQNAARAILKRYVDGKIGLDEAYCELLDESLIPMPSGCGLKAKIHSPDEEARLKELIRGKIL